MDDVSNHVVDSKDSAAEAPPGEAGEDLPSILCVDDDPNILDGFRRNFRKKFRVHTAAGPGEGLDVLNKSGPFAVVVTDYQMPGMDGIRFLGKVRTVAPDTVRIMLTGQADVAMAMGAVNQGNIFRFLLKPCTPLVLEKVLQAGIEQHRRLISERELMQETLLGCVQVLVELLGVVKPEAFSRATRLRRYVKRVAVKAGLRGVWQIEAAAMLCQIGWITLPPDLLAKAAAGGPFLTEELPIFQAHSSAAARMLEKIPRLDLVARMIERRHIPFAELPHGLVLDSSDLGAVGAQVLKAAIGYDTLRHHDLDHETTLQRMRQDTGAYMPEILETMTSIEWKKTREEIEDLPLFALSPGMILEEDLRSSNGILLMGKGQEVTATFVQRLMSCGYGVPSDHLCKVRVLIADGD